MQDFIGMKRGLVVTGMQVSFLGETKGNNFWGYGNGPYQYSSLLPIGMAISRVFWVTCPNLPLLEQVWEHRNRGWAGFSFFLKTQIGFGVGIGFSNNLTRPEYEITTLPSTYKYLLHFIISGFLLLSF